MLRKTNWRQFNWHLVGKIIDSPVLKNSTQASHGADDTPNDLSMQLNVRPPRLLRATLVLIKHILTLKAESSAWARSGRYESPHWPHVSRHKRHPPVTVVVYSVSCRQTIAAPALPRNR